MPFEKHRAFGQSPKERVLEEPELIGKAITVREAKEVGRMAGADGMQTAIRQCRHTEIIPARPRQGDSGSSKRERILPAPPAHTQDPLPHCSKRCESVGHTWKHPARNSGTFRGITSAEHDYGAATALASSGVLQRNSRNAEESSARRRHLLATD